jgi:hypothetical protein
VTASGKSSEPFTTAPTDHHARGSPRRQCAGAVGGGDRKKPVVIDAVQFHLRQYADNPLILDETPAWLKDAVGNGIITPVFKTGDYRYLNITTLEGDHVAGPGDWIIRGSKASSTRARTRLSR